MATVRKEMCHGVKTILKSVLILKYYLFVKMSSHDVDRDVSTSYLIKNDVLL